MELFIYLQTLPFLKPILSDAYCMLKLDKNIIALYDSNIYDSITTNNNNQDSNIRLDIVIAVDIKHKPGYNNIDVNIKEYEPALYFIFNKKYHFLVDHTLITELAAPRNADTSLPVALYKFSNITLRFWIDNNDDVYRNNNNNGQVMTNSDCFNKLKDVIGLMNKLLPNTVVNHKVLDVPRPYFEISKEDDSNNNNERLINDTVKLASPPSLPHLMADKLDNWLAFLECSDNILSPSITVNGISVAAISSIGIDSNHGNDIQAYLKSNIIPSSNNKKRSYLYSQAGAHFCNSLLSRSEVSMLSTNYHEIKEEAENRINNYLDQLYQIDIQESNDSNSQPNKKSKSGYDSSDNDHSQKNTKKHDSDSTTNSNHNTSDILGKIKIEIEVISKASQDLSILRSLPSIEL